MLKRFAVIALAIFLVPTLVSAEALVLSRANSGAPNYIAGDLGQVDTGKALVGDSAHDALRGILMNHFGARGDEGFELIRSNTDRVGGVHARFQQTLNGLPVHGAQVILHYKGDNGAIYAVSGDFAATDKAAFSPTLDALDAFAPTARLRGDRVSTDAELAYVMVNSEAKLAWARFESYEDANGPQVDLVFADALTGEILSTHPQNHYARSLLTYNCNNGTSCGSLVSSSSNPINTGDNAIDSAHNYAIATYDYYLANHGRDSLNNAGLTLRSRVHYSNNYNNAFWDGTQMTYGDGDGVTFVPLSQDADVVAHELTHGVTSYESNLTYSYESGALNEALSDIFGAMVDRQEGATGNDIWLVGEDIYTPGTPGDGLRDMACPSCVGDYDYYPTRYTGSSDNGGVHWNSGIANLAFKLLVTGGTHPAGATSNSVPSIGFDHAADIFYDANVNCLAPSSNFQAARNCTAASALSLFGSTDEAAVQEAWDAVGVPGGGGPPPGGGGCSDTNIWTGTASSGTPNLVTPNCSASGTFNGVLSCDNGAADLDLYLEKQSCSGWFGCSFGSVASSTSAGCDESVTGYSGSSGTYRWRTNWYSGPAEPFHLCTNKC